MKPEMISQYSKSDHAKNLKNQQFKTIFYKMHVTKENEQI